MELKNHVKVGVKAWSGAQKADEENPWSSSVQCLGLEIDGKRINLDPENITGAELEVDGGITVLQVGIIVGKFETVPFEELAPPEHA